MRKVLLATTALVAMSVTAAQADVSIGGQAVFEIASPDQTAQILLKQMAPSILRAHPQQTQA